MSLLTKTGVLFAALPLFLAACGTSTQSVFEDGSPQLGSTAPPQDGFGSSGGQGQPANPDTAASCAATSATDELKPVNLIVVFDRSGSMGDTTEDPSFDPQK